ncbi:MAG: hypothetical protein KA734_10445 [Fluviicola sp.]|nr:hypothetical protein [Fluviicola sp.]
MELIKQHIYPCLLSFAKRGSSTFEANFDEIQNNLRTDLIKLIRYLDNLLDETFSTANDNVTALHIHIEDEFNDSQKLLIAEFLSVKTFLHYQSSDNNSNDANLALIELKAAIETKLNGLKMRCPAGASGINGGNRIWKNWVKEKKENRSLLEFYKSLNESSSLKPKLIINTQKNFCSSVSQIFEFKPYCVLINSENKSYNLLNATQTLNEIDAINNEIIDELDSIILFDCERKSVMSNFSFEEINKWNSNYDTRFTKYLIITFGKKYTSINHTRNKLELIKERFKIPTNTAYTITKSEIDFLINRKESTPLSIEFVGFESSSFWDEFILETKVYDLYELRSIKLMNIYALCYNEEIKNYILNNIFLNDCNGNIITAETKQEIFSLPESDIQNIKTHLSNSLDTIVNSNLKSRIIESLANEYKIVVDNSILKNTEFLNIVQRGINVRTNRKFINWDVFDEINCEQIIILSYRDQGNFNHHFYPNINENKVSENTYVQCILPAMLFKQFYEWSKYNLENDYYKILNHPIRSNNFKWDDLKRKIYELKPGKPNDISWDLESSYNSSDTRVTYRFTFMDNSRITCNPSDLFIYKQNSANNPRIQNIRWIYENIDTEETAIEVKNLDLLIDEFNPAERLIDTTQHDNDLEIIRNQFGFEDESAGRLWKILLARKITEIGKVKLYEDLKDLFIKNNISIVSFSHFESTWINPDSESLVPRGNKVFKVLCDYLQMPITYRRIIYTIKNKTINGKRNATRIYSKLLKDLFNDGCFDEEVNPEHVLSNRLEYYRSNHNLDELGIDEDNPMSGLLILIELIIPELSYKKVTEIKRTSNE